MARHKCRMRLDVVGFNYYTFRCAKPDCPGYAVIKKTNMYEACLQYAFVKALIFIEPVRKRRWFEWRK